MGLGPSLSIRQSQQLILTPQLRQAIQLLQLSNLELEAFLAEELSKNPLLEAQGGDGDTEAPAADFADQPEGDEAPDDPGADDLIRGQVEDDRPLDVDRTAEALETDSFSDVVTSSSSDEAFDFDRLQYSAASLSEHLINQLHGVSGPTGDLARIIAEALDETGYLSVPIDQIAELSGARLELVGGCPCTGTGSRSAGSGCAIVGGVPRTSGEGSGPLRPRDGAADRQSRASLKRPDRRPQAHLRRR